MRVNFRQGVVSYQAGGFLQITGGGVTILATNRSATVTIAHQTTDYTHSEDNTVNDAWAGPFSETRYWLYWDFNLLTFARTFGTTTLEPVAQSVAPGAGDENITSVIVGSGSPSDGAFTVDATYNLSAGTQFTVANSTGNDGTYTVSSISTNSSPLQTTIYVNEPVVSAVVDGKITLDVDLYGKPLKSEGRNWYNTSTNIHYVLNGGVWQKVLRVFAAQLLNGNTFISVSQNSQSGDFTGTQIGNNTSIFSGRVLIDESSDPIRRDDGTFFTTEDQFFTNQARVDALRLESNVTKAQCIASALSAFSVVAWTNDGQVDTAQYDDVGNTVVGLLTENLTNLEVGGIIVQGSVTNPLWNWTSTVSVGSTLWVDNGTLVTVDPHVSAPVTYPTPRVPVARVLDKDTIIFEQGLGGIGEQGPQGSAANLQPADTTNIGGVTLVSPSSDNARAFVISDTDSRLSDARAPLAHTHQAIDVTFQPGAGVFSNEVQSAIEELGNTKLSLDGGIMTGFLSLSENPTSIAHATTKQYVDNLVNGLIWLEPIDGVNLIDDSITAPPSSPNHGDAYILPGDGSGLWTGIVAGEIVIWNNTTSLWVNLGPIQSIHTGAIRIGIAMQSTTTPAGSFIGKKNQFALFDTSGNITGYEIPVNNNAVYVDGDASLFAFDQFAFDGIKWVKFGGSDPITGDSVTTVITGGKISVIPASTGGTVDALKLNGLDTAALDLRWAPFTITPYSGDGTWGNADDSTSGQITSTTVTAALNELADKKAEKTPSYAAPADLPVIGSPNIVKGMLATVDAANTVYFADDTGWAALMREDSVPYDLGAQGFGTLADADVIMRFIAVRDFLLQATDHNGYAVTAPSGSSAVFDVSLLTTAGGSTSSIGTMTFAAASQTPTLSGFADTSVVAGNIITITTTTASSIADVALTLIGHTIQTTILVGPYVYFDDTYWQTGSNYAWDGTKWLDSLGNWFKPYIITLGTWNVGFRPASVTISVTMTDDTTINIYDTNGSIIGTADVLGGPATATIALTFTTFDIDKIETVIGSNYFAFNSIDAITFND